MRILGVAWGTAVTLLISGVPPAAAQVAVQNGINSGVEAKAIRNVQNTSGPPVDKPSAAVATPATAATPATPATPAGDSGPATPATPATPASPASPAESGPPLVPPGLSGHAPDTAPKVGVVGGGRSSKGSSPAATPEPSTLLLMGAGLAGVYGLRRRRR